MATTHDRVFPSAAPTAETDLESSDGPTEVAPGTLMTDPILPGPCSATTLIKLSSGSDPNSHTIPTDKQLGHQALSLGLTDKVLCILGDRNQSLEDQTRRQWRFRLARMNGAQNPYAELIPPDLQKLTDLQMAHSRRTWAPAVVSVHGGIGDHLEVISMLLEWSQINDQTFALVVTPERQKDFKPNSQIIL